MAVRIVHFGSDNLNRVDALKSRGYSVDECISLTQLHASLVGILPTDAVVIAENDETMADHALSLVRGASTVPLILFRDGNSHYSRAEFDLVVASDSASDAWLREIADLIASSMRLNR